jgi:septum formation protein
MQHPSIILASTSPIRSSILLNAGIMFSCQPPNLDEKTAKLKLTEHSPKNLALHLAELKALSISKPNTLIIGADQTLSCEQVIFNKPKTQSSARSQLIALRGKTHTLHSALACAENGKIIWKICDEAHLTMRSFSDSFLESYIYDCGDDILSSVGSYQLEKQGVQLFEKLEGDYFTILGLPLLPLLTFLRGYGIAQL